MKLTIPLFSYVKFDNLIYRWKAEQQCNEIIMEYHRVYDISFSFSYYPKTETISEINSFSFNINHDIIGLDIQRALWIYNEYVKDIFEYEDLYDFMEAVDIANRIFMDIKQNGVKISTFDRYDKYVRYIAFEDGWRFDPEQYEKNIWLISAATEVISRDELKTWFMTIDLPKIRNIPPHLKLKLQDLIPIIPVKLC